jgi:transcriptional regulator with XRE-family HTH domain
MHAMNNEQAQRLGSILKARRDELGLSTYAVADAVGVEQSTIVRFEKGAFLAPRPDKLARLAEALGLVGADLFAMAGYTTPGDLPSLGSYLRIKYCDLPEEDLDNIEAYATKLAKKRGVGLRPTSAAITI